MANDTAALSQDALEMVMAYLGPVWLDLENRGEKTQRNGSVPGTESSTRSSRCGSTG